MYQKEICYLSLYGRFLLDTLIAKGIQADLAFEVLHLLVPNEDLYILDEAEYVAF